MPTKKGRGKYIETPEKLWELFLEYVEHEKNNPMYRVDYVGRDGTTKKTPLETPLTFEGFECFLWDKEIITNLSQYEVNADGRYTGYIPIITRIKQNCFTHNIKGAAVGLFNANIIARKLGLKDNQEVKQEGKQEIIVKYADKKE